MHHIRLAVLLVVLVSTAGMMAAEPVSQNAAEPAATCDVPASVEAFGFEPSFGEPIFAQVCDPNRECVSDADCGQFGYCAVWRMCVCSG